MALGVGRIRRAGTDLTLFAVGYLVHHALKLAEELAEEGISVEVFDPRTVFPLDYPLLAESVARTGRLVVLDDTNRTCGLAADVAANIGELCWRELKGPVRRVTRADSPVPFAVPLEEAVLASPGAPTRRSAKHSQRRRWPMHEVHMPKVGTSGAEAEILAINVAVGDRVAPGDELFEAESDKANFSIESEVAGTVAEILVEVEGEYDTGAVLARIEVDG